MVIRCSNNEKFLGKPLNGCGNLRKGFLNYSVGTVILLQWPASHWVATLHGEKRNIIELGKNLDSTLHQIQKELPLGLDIHQVANQPQVVEKSIDEFVKSLAEAIIIVLIVSFISLGTRSGRSSLFLFRWLLPQFLWA